MSRWARDGGAGGADVRHTRQGKRQLGGSAGVLARPHDPAHRLANELAGLGSKCDWVKGKLWVTGFVAQPLRTFSVHLGLPVGFE